MESADGTLAAAGRIARGTQAHEARPESYHRNFRPNWI